MFLGWPPSPSFCQSSGTSVSAIQVQPSDTGLLLPGTRFHLDFGFIRASSADFGVTMGNRVVTSYDGNKSYLIIVCAKTRHTWVLHFVKHPTRLRFSSLSAFWPRMVSSPALAIFAWIKVESFGVRMSYGTLLLPQGMYLNQLVPMPHPRMAKSNGMFALQCWPSSTFLVCSIGSRCLSEEPPLCVSLSSYYEV
jgi:hypothetical protein